MLCKNLSIWRIAVLALSACATNSSIAQNNGRAGDEESSEIVLRHEDHRNVVDPVNKSIARNRDFMMDVFLPAINQQYQANANVAAKLEIPQPLRSQMLGELSHMHNAAQRALNKSESYSRFKHDKAECKFWVEVMRYYVEGLGGLIEEMGKADLPSSAFAGMAMNQVSTAVLGIASLHPAVMPCFLEKGSYGQALTPMIREKAEELRGSKPQAASPGAQ